MVLFGLKMKILKCTDCGWICCEDIKGQITTAPMYVHINRKHKKQTDPWGERVWYKTIHTD